MNKQHSSKQRKIYKLKRANVKLGQQRKSYENNLHVAYEIWKNTCVESEKYQRDFYGIKTSCLKNISRYYNKLRELSEQIGKNSAKIQRLRTLISQEKSISEKDDA